MHILSFTSLYPNPKQPTFGIFVENRLRHLYALDEIQGGVIAPVSRSGLGQSVKSIPSFEVRNGLEVWHPPFWSAPKMGMYTAPYALYRAGKKVLKAYIAERGKPDLLDIHYIYPDGVAGAWLSKEFGIPCVMTARGTDISLLPQYHFPRYLIKGALKQASAVITVCEALRTSVIRDLNIDPEKVHTLRNGVDLYRFQPAFDEYERELMQQKWGITGRTLLSVGHLVERKGHHLVIEALPHLPSDVSLMIAGSGEEQSRLEALIKKLNLGNRVRFVGNLPPDELVTLYQAVDLLVLASSREGWANVLLEAMACGTPAAATAIWGTPEIIQWHDAGVLIPQRTPLSIAQTVERYLRNMPDREATRLYAERFSWDETTVGQYHLFEQVIDSARKKPKKWFGLV